MDQIKQAEAILNKIQGMNKTHIFFEKDCVGVKKEEIVSVRKNENNYIEIVLKDSQKIELKYTSFLEVQNAWNG
jgi:hypothetical protein